MRAVEIITASFLMALGGVVLTDAVRLGHGWGSDGPESGFLPFWLGTILVVCCVIIIVQALRQKSTKPFCKGEQFACVLKVLLPATTMVLLTQFVGLYVAGAVYMAMYMRWVGRHSWAATVGLPVTFSLVTFVVFERWFLVPLPKGPLEAWLGY